MREIPECLNRRYQTLDKLIRDLSTSPPEGSVTPHPSVLGNEVGVKLMCDFWNILKEDPECDLPQEVQQRLCGKDSIRYRSPQQVECYRASNKLSKDNLGRKRDGVTNRIKRICVPKEEIISKCAEICASDGEKLPLTQVLFNIKEAASFDKKCHARVEELMSTQRELTEQIQNLEERERQGVQLLKQADCMWSCMEESYKKKIFESQERYNALMTQLKEIENNALKWRKHRKDLEFQLRNINQCGDDIKEKINQKTNDLKVMGMEIEEFKKRIESNAKDLNVAQNSYRSKREASDARMQAMAAKMKQLQQRVAQENKLKNDKEIEGSKYVKEARDDLQKICKVLLQKKIENEDVRAENDALLQEIDLLKETCDSCKLRCQNREKSIAEEMARVEKELVASKAKCIKCHQNTDTIDVRKYCTDCPRCLAERDCVYADDHCSADHSMDCVCMSVKQKFLDNVFDNMYTVLERQSKTCPGKAVADCVLSCLKKSRNGKLTKDTRKILQDFILSTVKKNLNLTIVGGAVKTRCEMDPETYKQLMLCLKDIKVERPVKEDKGIGAKKEPCHRWGASTECHCPKGPKGCVCNKAPQPPTDPHSCGLESADEDPTPTDKTCPQRESLACSTDCGMLELPGAPSNWQREPCADQSCPFAKNMRAAQCVLGPESLSSVQKAHPLPTIIKKRSLQDKMATCTCGSKPVKPCPCHRDRSQPRQRIFEEVMGRYSEVSPIEKVSKAVPDNVMNSERRVESECDCSNLPVKYLLSSKSSENKISQYCACSSNYISRDKRTPFIKKQRRRGPIKICRNNKSDHANSVDNNLTSFSDVSKNMPRTNKELRDKSDDDIKMILCPKFSRGYEDKTGASLGTINFMDYAETTHLKLKFKSSSKIDQDFHAYEARFVEKKVCETVKELMKEIVVPHTPPTTPYITSPKVEWVTLGALYKEISSLAKLEDLSTETVNEVEVKCETLEASKDFKLINKNLNEVKAISVQNEKIDTENFITVSDKQASSSMCYSDEMSGSFGNTTSHNNKIAEELKLKLLEDIRETYNISIETSLDHVQEFDGKTMNLKHLRKCLHKLQAPVTEQNKCSCSNRKRQWSDANKSNIRKPQNYYSVHDLNIDTESLNNCTVVINESPKNKPKKNNTVTFNKQVKSKLDHIKRNKIKTANKKFRAK